MVGLHVCRNEWFEPNGIPWATDASMNVFRKAHGVDYVDCKDPRLNKWVRENIAETLNVLQLEAPEGTQACVLKVFEDHLSEQEFDRHFLHHQDMRFIILKRRPIDSYISFLKAVENQTWLERDTTSMKVCLQSDDYVAWHKKRSHWFSSVEGKLKAAGRKYEFLDYDADILPGEEYTVQRLTEVFERLGISSRVASQKKFKKFVKSALFDAMGAVGVESPWHPRLGIWRQDKSPASRNKVENWDAFVRELDKATGGSNILDSYSP